MNYHSKTMKLVSINCPYLSNTRNFVGHEQLSYSTPRTKKCLVNARALIALPFISSKLMDLPDLSIDHVLSTVLKTLTDYDRKTQQRTTINLSKEADNSTTVAQDTRTGEYLHDPITDGSQDLDRESDNTEYCATSIREESYGPHPGLSDSKESSKALLLSKMRNLASLPLDNRLPVKISHSRTPTSKCLCSTDCRSSPPRLVKRMPCPQQRWSTQHPLFSRRKSATQRRPPRSHHLQP
jgi:hypothetical protein